MADIGKTVKEIWEQSMKAVNKAATNIATSTKQKVDEMNIVTRRKELQNQLGLRLYELWQAGEDVPETLKATLVEMRDLEVKLQELRESKTAAPEDEKSAETPVAPSDLEPCRGGRGGLRHNGPRLVPQPARAGGYL